MSSLNIVSIRRQSGKRGSNSRPPAWEASALPTELLPHFAFPVKETSLSISLPLRWSRYRDSNPGPTHYECVALPTEPYRQNA